MIGPGDASIDTYVQDQTTPPVILPLAQVLKVTTSASQSLIESYSVELTDITGVTTGLHVRIINNTTSEFYAGTILGIVGNFIQLDSPLDATFAALSEVTISNINMAVDGSGEPVHFHLRTGFISIPAQIDITRIIMVCQTSSAVDLNKFGDIAGGLTRGLVFREENGIRNNIFNVKTNADLVSLAYDWTPFSASNPSQATDGFSWRLTFGGQNKIGIVLRIEQDGQLGLIVQDDLRSLVDLKCIVEGHIVN